MAATCNMQHARHVPTPNTSNTQEPRRGVVVVAVAVAALAVGAGGGRWQYMWIPVVVNGPVGRLSPRPADGVPAPLAPSSCEARNPIAAVVLRTGKLVQSRLLCIQARGSLQIRPVERI
jgi:hypothetical protein